MFRSVIAEEEPWADEKSIHHFCPEVSYDTFSYFASDMFEYLDERDRERAYERDGKQSDPRWASVTPRHYTKCREYSIHGTFAAGKPSKASPQRKGLTPKRRWQALARDCFTCVYCGRKPPDVELTVDHKVSVKDGGSDDLDNLVTACGACNSGKGGSSV
ncbi:MAG: HNH endonuclease signature motif containing protein [Acidobacteria bacterium]|nr:HNH endonuclease signature motif containing protein [Acidobacteriota bacterium]